MSLFCPTCHNLLHLGDSSDGMSFKCQTCAYFVRVDEKVHLKKMLNPKVPDDAISAKEEIRKNPKTPGEKLTQSGKGMFYHVCGNACGVDYFVIKICQRTSAPRCFSIDFYSFCSCLPGM